MMQSSTIYVSSMSDQCFNDFGMTFVAGPNKRSPSSNISPCVIIYIIRIVTKLNIPKAVLLYKLYICHVLKVYC